MWHLGFIPTGLWVLPLENINQFLTLAIGDPENAEQHEIGVIHYIDHERLHLSIVESRRFRPRNFPKRGYHCHIGEIPALAVW